MTRPCGCCEGLRAETPADLTSPPGLPALQYRAGTHASFLATMLAALPRHAPLDRLTTREPADASVAFLDAWATVADVLTFYDERIANEGYLRTATERRSLVELARLVGYVPRPGVAAGVHLAFTLDAGYRGEVPAGTRGQSLPGAGEVPQSFETAEPLAARAEWNEIRPRLVRGRRIDADTGHLYVDGTPDGLRPNGLLLLFATRRPVLLQPIATVVAQPEEQRTLITLQRDTPPEALRRSLRGLRDLAAHGVSAGATAGRVTEVIDELLRRASARGLLATIDRTLPRVETLRDQARPFAKLGPWTERVLAALEEGRVALAAELAPPSTPGAAAAAAAGGAPATGGIDDVLRLLPEIEEPPSRPPRSELELARPVAELFTPVSGIIPEILGALRPDARGDLYRAWARTGTDTERGEVHALVLVAAPFGAQAPRRPLFDERGAVVGDDEWPLAGSVVIEVEYRREQDVVVGVDGRRSDPVSLEQLGAGATVAVADLGVELSGSDDGVIAEFAGQNHRIRIVPGDGGTITIGVDDLDERTLRLRQALRFRAGSSTVSMRYRPSTAEEGGGPRAFVTVETCLPPAEGTRHVLTLDGRYPGIVTGSWAAIVRADEDEPRIRQVTAVRDVAVARYGLTGRVTELELDDDWLTAEDCDLSVVRRTTVHAQDVPLVLRDEPIVADVAGDRIELGALFDGLEPGRWLIVTGERADLPGVPAAELAMLARAEHGYDASIPGDRTHTTLVLAEPLAHTYRLETVVIRGNVAPATHGETREEILGSADAGRSALRFTLRQFPLTYIAAPTASGTLSTLQVRVGGLLWHEARSIAELGPRDRAYVTETDDDDRTTVVFGTGTQGARPPSGTENVAARYRTGIGRAGNVRAGQITLLSTRPLGVTGVVNPLSATGGADRDSREQIRRNAPLGIKALDRVVSTRDHADFARTFAGIGKAFAVHESDGARQVVHVTVAGVDDIPIRADSDLLVALRRAIRAHGDPHQFVVVAPRELILVVVEAGVRIDADHRWDLVEPRLRAAMLEAFGFTRRELGQDVLLSEVMSTLQAVSGVAYVDVDVLDAVPASDPAAAAQIGAHRRRLDRIAVYPPYIQPPPVRDLAPAARPAARPRPAQLALLTADVPDTLILKELPA